MTTLNAAIAAPRNTAPASGLFTRIGAFFALMGAVHRIKVSLESRRDPSADDLQLLGINPAQMPKMYNARD